MHPYGVTQKMIAGHRRLSQPEAGEAWERVEADGVVCRTDIVQSKKPAASYPQPK